MSTGDERVDRLLAEVGRRIRARRKELHLSAKRASERADGINHRHWQKIEAGEVNITLNTLVRVAKALRVDPYELFPPSRSAVERSATRNGTGKEPNQSQGTTDADREARSDTTMSEAFLNALERAAGASAEIKHAVRLTCWNAVLDTFIACLNEKYADALRAFRDDGAASGIVQLIVTPRGRRNYRSTLLVFRFTRSGAHIVGDSGYELESPLALAQWLTDLVRTKTFRDIVDKLREQSRGPVIGVLHAGEVRDRRPSTDVLVTLSADEQAKLGDASEAKDRQPITLQAQLAGPAPAGQGIYAPDATLRWLTAGGYGLQLDADGHKLEEGGVLRLSGAPVDPALLE